MMRILIPFLLISMGALATNVTFAQSGDRGAARSGAKGASSEREGRGATAIEKRAPDERDQEEAATGARDARRGTNVEGRETGETVREVPSASTRVERRSEDVRSEDVHRREQVSPASGDGQRGLDVHRDAGAGVRRPSARARGVTVPPGHYPPAGSCRLWYPNRPPGHQPPSTSCSALRGRVPDGTFVLYGDRAFTADRGMTRADARRKGIPEVVIDVLHLVR